ncbi:MAG: DNA-3-methyladenine glycosylase, partial [Candidatus Obscuribacterales bacterium]|nr:DNA-3-methyladenine glycosylase [Candidatus Obscuribacterales bacterium]
DDFYRRSTLLVARDLLGAQLCRNIGGKTVLSGPIVEVEAYTADDPACHASRGKTKRCEVMFGPPGHAYVYFIYGMYHCLNVVTEPDGVPGAVLIRAVGADGADGPGKLCRQWQIDAKHNGVSLVQPGSELWICPSEPLKDSEIAVTARIGISAAQDRLWRFFIKDHPAVSGKKQAHKAYSARRR